MPELGTLVGSPGRLQCIRPEHPVETSDGTNSPNDPSWLLFLFPDFVSVKIFFSMKLAKKAISSTGLVHTLRAEVLGWVLCLEHSCRVHQQENVHAARVSANCSVL